MRADRRGCCRGSGGEVHQRGEVPAIYRELLDVAGGYRSGGAEVLTLIAECIADYLHFIDIYGRRLQDDILAEYVALVQVAAALFRGGVANVGDRNGVRSAERELPEAIFPLALVMVRVVKPVEALRTITDAPGTSCLDSSDTTPKIEACVVWARSPGTARQLRQSKRERMCFMQQAFFSRCEIIKGT